MCKFYIAFDRHIIEEKPVSFSPPFLERVVGTTLLRFVLMCRVTSLVKIDTGSFYVHDFSPSCCTINTANLTQSRREGSR